jgi:hypothetical protein
MQAAKAPIKIRNARGDRVVESQEFFRGQGLEDTDEPCEFELKHEPELGGFRLLARREIDDPATPRS